MSYTPHGIEVAFVIPAVHVTLPVEEVSLSVVAERGGAPSPPVSSRGSILLVEDSLMIAIHLENIVRQPGLDEVSVAGNVVDALAELDPHAPAMAILDYNLGAETSLAVADQLLARRIPYLFATGYGDQLALPERHRDAPVIPKPYNGETIRQCLYRGAAAADGVPQGRARPISAA
jgi:CheY-like chemotaxis protein